MSPNNKIVDINTLSKTLERARVEKKKVILCHGIFDLLHIGHIRYFEQARKYGDILIVTVTPAGAFSLR